jgi:GTP pyrophosphokinase
MGNLKIFVHDKEELDELCNRLLALTGIEKVERYDTEETEAATKNKSHH